jgi:hypothetical protein
LKYLSCLYKTHCFTGVYLSVSLFITPQYGLHLLPFGQVI